MPAKKPDWSLGVQNKENGDRGNIGAGWTNTDGSITIKLNPGCALAYDPNIVPRLFPANYKAKPRVTSLSDESEPSYDGEDPLT